MDVYRIGTLLELMRELAFTFADDGKRVKVSHDVISLTSAGRLPFQLATRVFPGRGLEYSAGSLATLIAFTFADDGKRVKVSHDR